MRPVHEANALQRPMQGPTSMIESAATGKPHLQVGRGPVRQRRRQQPSPEPGEEASLNKVSQEWRTRPCYEAAQLRLPGRIASGS